MAYCAGTGGSILMLALPGVAAMGLENRLHLVCEEDQRLALVGYLAGAIFYIIEYNLMH